MRKLIVGLGNPGAEYNKTRHNVGFMLVDKIHETFGSGTFKHKFAADYLELSIQNHKALLLKPQTYMNLSGQAVSQAIHFYKIPLDDILVIHDDIDLEVGKIKVKVGGSSGGHNGLKSIDELVGKEYQRIRVGVARPDGSKDVSSHVLTKFTPHEFKVIENSMLAIIKNITILLAGDAEKFMNKCALFVNEFKKGNCDGI
jgi:peptidyl-tRNA hydrolase, PTH1 family